MGTSSKESVLVDLTKQIATVSGALLALLASLAPKYLSGLSGLALWLLAIAAVLLLLTAVASLVSHALCIKYVSATCDTRKSTAWNSAAAGANVAFFSFAISLLLLLASGSTQFINPRDVVTVETLVIKATNFLRDEDKISDTESWRSLEQVTVGNDEVLKLVYYPRGKPSIVCHMNLQTGEFVSCN